MSFKDIAKEIDNYKKVYLEGRQQIDRIKNSTDLNEQAKASKIADIVTRYEGAIETASNKVVEVIDKTKEELKAKKLKNIENGFFESDQILAITNGIKAGAYDKPMLEDIIEVYRNNQPMLRAIYAELVAGDNEELKLLASEIPKDSTNDVIAKLDKAKQTIEGAPKLNANIINGDWGAQLWQNGTAVDNLITFILGLEDLVEDIA